MNPDTDHQMDALRLLSQDIQKVRNWIDANEQIAETQLTEEDNQLIDDSLEDVMRTAEKQKQDVRESRARLRALFASYRQTIKYLKGQVKERDGLLHTLRAETDAMADVVKDIKNSYGIDEVA
ncbi:hypothetical protein LEP1GSC166_1868 [Leptospira kirschneri]|uniref:hypothetical protein n=1 Tax=Leptospira kirschneri TaxID=29507 RepID=UPI0002BD8516|nr:hypothetical protein [Leptospira kirschneri]EMK02923.1 hypothetical protein LEP1GSC166_1868 [Leptospira kirschneri]